VTRPIPIPGLRRDGLVPLADQIAAHFRSGIGSGCYRPGERLPTIRAVAEGCEVTRNTVQLAYRRLAEEGLVHATVGRGTIVAGSTGRPDRGLSRSARAAWRALRASPRLPAVPDGQPLVADFAGLQPDDALFPFERFGVAMNEALRLSGSRLLGYGEPAGSRDLREALARRHAADGRGDPDRILITTGAQQGIDLVLRTFTEPGDAVAVAVPTYPQLFGALAAHGLELLPVESRAGVADLDALRQVLARADVRLLYVMPSFHNPTGATLDTGQRRALMDVVARTDVPVVEDEYECELRFAGEEPPALATLDPRGRTVTVRSFSKGLFPGVRIGWVEGPADILGPMTALKRFGDLESSPLLQAVLLEFLRSGDMDAYLGELRAELRARHRRARSLLARSMPEGTEVTAPDGGLSLWVGFPVGVDVDRIARAAARDGVLVTPGRAFDPFDRPSRGFRLSLSRVPLDRIDRGIEILARHAQGELAGVGADLSSPPPLIL
jgi:DNA-binding transcriptional MocR family regulator